MPRATRDGVSIYYEHEAGSGEPVAFLQGLGYGRWMWRWQREALAGEYEVLAPDTRGTGRSDSGLPGVLERLPGRLRTPLVSSLAGYSVEGLAADLEAVLDDAGPRSVHLVGAGLGGMVAQQHALEYDRAKTLTLVGTSHGGEDAVAMPEETREALLGGSKSSRRETLRHRMRPILTERFTNRNPRLIDRILEWRLEQDADDPALAAQLAATRSFDVRDRVWELSVPTLLIHGTDDRVVPVENAHLLHEKLPDSRLELVEGGSHLAPVENADRVTDELLAFLEEQARAGTQ